MIRLLISVALLCLMVSACGKSDEKKDVLAEKAVIKLPSAICGECANTITTAVKKVNGVNSIMVDTDTKLATVEFIPAMAKVSDIEQAIVMAGYDANDKKADATAFEKLPDCCKK
ncbi:heavy-metal-associated domain-containing protein [bacterium]|nr:heavy-metal-associated domain-containing protein [bacterium]